MNSSFPNRWSFSYLKFTKYVTNIIADPFTVGVSGLVDKRCIESTNSIISAESIFSQHVYLKRFYEVSYAQVQNASGDVCQSNITSRTCKEVISL